MSNHKSLESIMNSLAGMAGHDPKTGESLADKAKSRKAATLYAACAGYTDPTLRAANHALAVEKVRANIKVQEECGDEIALAKFRALTRVNILKESLKVKQEALESAQSAQSTPVETDTLS